MNTASRLASLFAFSLVLSSVASGQAMPAATQLIHLSAFGGATGSYTGLESSKNLGITAGFDVGFKPFYRLYPSFEVRGTYPIDSGTVAGERNILFGVKIERPYHDILHPYGDVLYGRNKIVYGGAGYPNSQGTLLYVDSIANVISFGGGVDIDLTPHFAAKFDAQLQRYGTPVTASGDIYAKAFMAAVVYRFDFNRSFHYDRKTDQATNLRKEPAPRTPPPPPPPAQGDAAVDATAAPTPDASAAPVPAPDASTPAPTPAPAPDSSTPPATPPPAQQPQ